MDQVNNSRGGNSREEPEESETDAGYHTSASPSMLPVVVMRGLDRQYAAALTNFVGYFLFSFYLVSLFSSSSVLWV